MNAILQDIPIDRLIPHPENSNYMSAEIFGKLRRHIEWTGRYEPLTVRPHPTLEEEYEILNGHNRLRVLSGPGGPSLSLLPTPQALGEIHEGGVALVTEAERPLCDPAFPSFGLAVPLSDPLRFLAVHGFVGNS